MPDFDASPAPALAEPAARTPMGNRRRELLIEFAVVMTIGVVPPLLGSIRWALWSQGRYPFLMEAVSWGLILRSFTVSIPVLFIMWRSGDRWTAFGLGRPRKSDLLWGAAVFLATQGVSILLRFTVWPVLLRANLENEYGGVELIGPQTIPGVLAAVLVGCANGFTEELVMRSYFISRLLALGLSPAAAVTASATVFGAYHIYQGSYGAAGAFAFGLVFGLAFVRLKRLWPLAIAHGLDDLVPFLW